MSDDHIPGTFHHPVQCPECGSIMSTDYDPAGFPAAHCCNRSCPVDGFGDEWLKSTGNWTEAEA